MVKESRHARPSDAEINMTFKGGGGGGGGKMPYQLSSQAALQSPSCQRDSDEGEEVEM